MILHNESSDLRFLRVVLSGRSFDWGFISISLPCSYELRLGANIPRRSVYGLAKGPSGHVAKPITPEPAGWLRLARWFGFRCLGWCQQSRHVAPPVLASVFATDGAGCVQCSQRISRAGAPRAGSIRGICLASLPDLQPDRIRTISRTHALCTSNSRAICAPAISCHMIASPEGHKRSPDGSQSGVSAPLLPANNPADGLSF